MGTRLKPPNGWNGPLDKRHVGRKGKPNRMTTDIKAAVIYAIKALGRDHLLKWAQKSPEQFWPAVMRLLPREVALTDGEGGPVKIEWIFNFITETPEENNEVSIQCRPDVKQVSPRRLLCAGRDGSGQIG